MTAPDPPGPARTTVEFPAGQQYRSVPRLVLGGVASRYELPIDRVDDLLLAVESLLMQETVDETLRLEVEATPSGLLVRLSPFRPGRLEDPGVRRVLTPLVESVDERADGDAAVIELVVSVTYRTDDR